MQTHSWKVNPTLPLLSFLRLFFLLSCCFLSSMSLLQFLKAETALWESDHYWVHMRATRRTHTLSVSVVLRKKHTFYIYKYEKKNAPLKVCQNEIAGCIRNLWRYWKLISATVPRPQGRWKDVSASTSMCPPRFHRLRLGDVFHSFSRFCAWLLLS